MSPAKKGKSRHAQKGKTFPFHVANKRMKTNCRKYRFGKGADESISIAIEVIMKNILSHASTISTGNEILVQHLARSINDAEASHYGVVPGHICGVYVPAEAE